jgi:hypothetical protein
MKYEIDKWPIHKLIELYERGLITLDPPYQRNPIWTPKAKRSLINTIQSAQPIPNFFLLKKLDNSYEMVDGQQRASAIIGYIKGLFEDNQKNIFAVDTRRHEEEKTFLEYFLSVTIIEEVKEDESIEKFYALVNSSGLRLNRPELNKADYYDTKFLLLTTDLSDYPDFKSLKLFTPSSINRMNDVDFISELVALIKYGISDKKIKVDNMYDEDISDEEAESLDANFKKIIQHFKRFNLIEPLKITRFRQKNDFYSLFNFILSCSEVDSDSLDYYYRLLLKLSKYITPSQEKCDPLLDYARNCVTQTNSKKARESRHSFLKDLFLNKELKPNDTQEAIMEFFRMKPSDMISLPPYNTLDIDTIHDPYHHVEE